MAVRASAEVTLLDQTDATALVEWYQLSASATKPSKPTTTGASATPSGWSKSEPGITSDADTAKYLYTCLQLVWGDGTCSWGDVQLSSSYEAAKRAWNKAKAAQDSVDGLQVGGRNLLPVSESSVYLAAGQSSSAGGITVAYEGDGWFRVSGTRSGTSVTTVTLWTGEDGYNTPVNSRVPQEGGEDLTLSVEVEGTPFLAGTTYANSTHVVMYGNASSVSWRCGGFSDLVRSGSFSTYASVIRYYVGASSSGTVDGRFRVKLERGNLPTDWTPAPEDVDAAIAGALAEGVEYIEGTHGTVATNAWTGVTRDASLVAGKTIAYKMPSAGTSTAATLNLTLSGGGTTGAKALRRNNSTVTTQFAAGSVLMMTFDGTYWRITGLGSDTNYYDRTAYKASVTASEAIASARIGVFGTGTNAGKLQLLSTTAFDATQPILYVGTAYTADAMTQTNNYTFWGTAFNLTSTHAITGAAAGKAVYIVGTLSGTTFTPSSEVLTCTVPTAADGLHYLRLGLMSTASNAVLEAEHPLYAFLNGRFQRVDVGAQEVATATAQHFWTDADGAHISSEAGNAAGARNSLWNSLGMLFRAAANNLLAIVTGSDPGVDIYDGAGNAEANVVARFRGSLVELGRNSKSATISMLGGLLKIYAIIDDSMPGVTFTEGRIGFDDEYLHFPTSVVGNWFGGDDRSIGLITSKTRIEGGHNPSSLDSAQVDITATSDDGAKTSGIKVSVNGARVLGSLGTEDINASGDVSATGSATANDLTLGKGITISGINFGFSSATTNANGVTTFNPGLGVKPTAVFVSPGKSSSETEAVAKIAVPMVWSIDSATQVQVRWQRSDTNAWLASNAVGWYWLAIV